MKKILLASIGFSGIGFAIACGSTAPNTSELDAVTSEDAVESAAVMVRSLDANGAVLANCAGVLLGPNTVLTAGHCVTGATTYEATAPNADNQKATGVRAVTTGWEDVKTTQARRNHVDAAIIMLDSRITIAKYPRVTQSGAVDGQGLRYYEQVDGKLVARSTSVNTGDAKGFKLNYLAPTSQATVGTGGPLFDSKGRIYGVVSGLGLNSHSVHFARGDGFAAYFAQVSSDCKSQSAIRSGSLSILGWGSSSGGTNGGKGWGGTSGGYGGHGGAIEAGTGGGTTGGNPGGSPGAASSSGTPGSSGSGEPGTANSSSGSPGASSSGSPGASTTGTGCAVTPQCEVGACPQSGSMGMGSSGTSSGTAGTPGSSGTAGTPGSSSGTPGSSSGTSGTPASSSGGTNVHEDEDECLCDGACFDNNIDFQRADLLNSNGSGQVIR